MSFNYPYEDYQQRQGNRSVFDEIIPPTPEPIIQDYQQRQGDVSQAAPVAAPIQTTQQATQQTAPIQATPIQAQPQAQRPADAFFQRFVNTAPPVPEYDQAKEDRLRKLSRVNAMGRGIGLLGNIFSLMQGANVNRSQPDQIAPGAYSSYENMLDNYKKERDANKFQGFQKELQNTELGMRRADRQQGIDIEEARHQDALKAQAAKNALDWSKFTVGHNDKLLGLGLTDDRNKETGRHNKADEALGWAKINESKAKKTKDGGYTLYDDKRNPVIKLENGEIEKVVQMILKDPATQEMASKDLNLLKAQLGSGLSLQNIKTIVAHYWDRSDLVKQYLGTKQPQQPVDYPTTSTVLPNLQNNQLQPQQQQPNSFSYGTLKF